MRAYFVVLALLLPNLVLSQSYINKVFARRTRSSPKYVPSPRQVRISRFIQEPELQEVQQKNTDDIDLDLDLQQLVDNFGQEKSTTKPTSYSQAPAFLETSTSRPVQQVKDEEEDDVLPQLNHPLSEFEDGELSQNYMPSQELSYSGKPQGLSYASGKPQGLSYAPGKPQGFSYAPGKPQGLSYAPGKPQGLSYAPGNPQGLSYSPVKQAKEGGSLSSDALGDALGFEEDHNTVDWLKNSIRGEPGKDYPVYASVPETTFKCGQQQYPGYYADLDAQCQVFHICQADGRANAFLCPNGTIFSQRHFVCVWWYEFDCSTAEQFYELNAELYKETEARQAGLIGGSVPTLVGGSVPSLGDSSGKLSSPKENLNRMYMSQIDEFGVTSAPTYYSNGKTTLRSSNGAFKGTTQPFQYDVSSVDSVTPSSLDGQNYETTPYNLDEALGEEIHSETPLIESLSLTTNIPKINGAKSYGGDFKTTNGRSSPVNYYNNNKMTTLADFSYGSNNSPKPSYGANVKGLNKNGKTSPKVSQLPESPVKSARNGNGSSKPKSIYGNGNGLKQKSNGNGFKPSYSTYGSVKQ